MTAGKSLHRFGMGDVSVYDDRKEYTMTAGKSLHRFGVGGRECV